VIEIITAPAVAGWVAERIEGIDDAAAFGPFSAIGIGIDGRPVAGFVFTELRPGPHGNDVRVSVAAESGAKWARKEILAYLFGYAFAQLKCSRVTFVIREGNRHAERVSKKLGFRKEGVLRQGWDGKTNALVYGLLKTECKYL
jgi:RimJ/RimL family protein N-acetyltransferase